MRSLIQSLIQSLLLTLASAAFVHAVVGLSGANVGEVLGAGLLCNFDCVWYAGIATQGYQLEAGIIRAQVAANWAFFPAFPLIARSVGSVLGVAAPVALVATSTLGLFLSIWAFLVLVGEELGQAARLRAGLLLAFNPYVVYAYAGYTETFYFLVTTIAFLLLGRQRWVASGAAGALLAATRPTGVLFVAAYLLKALRVGRHNDGKPVNWADWSSRLLGLALIPLGLSLFMIYLHFHVGDALAFKHIQIGWGRVVGNPVTILGGALLAGGWDRYFAVVAVVALAMSGWLWRQRRPDYAVFLAASTLVPLATAVWSMPRYVFWPMPFVFGLVAMVWKRTWLFGSVLAASIAIEVLVIVLWINGDPVII